MKYYICLKKSNTSKLFCVIDAPSLEEAITIGELVDGRIPAMFRSENRCYAADTQNEQGMCLYCIEGDKGAAWVADNIWITHIKKMAEEKFPFSDLDDGAARNKINQVRFSFIEAQRSYRSGGKGFGKCLDKIRACLSNYEFTPCNVDDFLAEAKQEIIRKTVSDKASAESFRKNRKEEAEEKLKLAQLKLDEKNAKLKEAEEAEAKKWDAFCQKNIEKVDSIEEKFWKLDSLQVEILKDREAKDFVEAVTKLMQFCEIFIEMKQIAEGLDFTLINIIYTTTGRSFDGSDILRSLVTKRFKAKLSTTQKTSFEKALR